MMIDEQIQQAARELSRRQAEHRSRILREWCRELFGEDCPKDDADIVTVLLAKGYTITEMVPREGDTNTLALALDGRVVFSTGVPKPCAIRRRDG